MIKQQKAPNLKMSFYEKKKTDYQVQFTFNKPIK